MLLCSRRNLIAAALCMWLLALPAAAKDIAVISNKSNSVRTLGLPELTKICKGVTRRWPDGKEILLIMRDPDSPGMKLVLERVYGMNSEQVKAAIAAANQGRHERPAILVSDSDEAVVKAVQAMPGALGLVDVYSITGNINVLKIDGKVPLDPGYVLHGN